MGSVNLVSFVFVAFLPVLTVGYSPRTVYIEDHCGPTTVYTFTKDVLLEFSDVRSIFPGGYSCKMAFQNEDSSRQVQVRFLLLDTRKTNNCSSGAIVLSEGSKFLTPSYGVCGPRAPSMTYRTVGNKMTIQLTNKGKARYGDFILLITSIYNSTIYNNTCHGDDFRCSNALCVSSQLRCNGYNDCGDDSDEKDGCALAAAIIVVIVLCVIVVVVFLVVMASYCRRRRRSYVRVTQTVREYPTVQGPAPTGQYYPSYNHASSYQTI